MTIILYHLISFYQGNNAIRFGLALFLWADKLCFNTFFHNEDMQEITKHFVVCHVDAPGQHIGASQMPQGYDEHMNIYTNICHFNVRNRLYPAEKKVSGLYCMVSGNCCH